MSEDYCGEKLGLGLWKNFCNLKWQKNFLKFMALLKSKDLNTVIDLSCHHFCVIVFWILYHNNTLFVLFNLRHVIEIPVFSLFKYCLYISLNWTTICFSSRIPVLRWDKGRHFLKVQESYQRRLSRASLQWQRVIEDPRTVDSFKFAFMLVFTNTILHTTHALSSYL